MSDLHSSKSLVDGNWLPYNWRRLSSTTRNEIANEILEGRDVSYAYWHVFTVEDRRRISAHVRASQKWNVYHVARDPGKSNLQLEALRRYRDGVSTPRPTMTIVIDELDRAGPGMLYDKPNGGKRILPSVYTKLDKTWLKADKTWRMPTMMNDGHLQNSCKLLKESHGNLTERATGLLGRMANHFGNSPSILAKLQELCLEIQQVEVDEMYPIFQPLSQELASRKAPPEAETFEQASFHDGDLSW